MTTEIIDKLFLELSQMTTAKTAKELLLEDLLRRVLKAWSNDANQGDGIHEDDYPLYVIAMKTIDKNFGQNESA